MPPAMPPVSRANAGDIASQPAVMPTSPASAPFKVNDGSGFLKVIHEMIIATNAPAAAAKLVVTAILAAVFLNKTIWGRYMLALGRNEAAARYSGINTDRMTLLAYVISAVMAAVGGMLFALEGYSVALEESFHRQLEMRLTEAGSAVEVINLAVGGFGTLQELLVLQEEGLRYEPDLVVLGFYFGNDLVDNSRVLQSRQLSADHVKTASRPFLEPGSSAEWVVRRPDSSRGAAGRPGADLA